VIWLLLSFLAGLTGIFLGVVYLVYIYGRLIDRQDREREESTAL